ncbi:chaplin [Streptomyces sp. RB6PN25]|uniref:Chaplin n=1 Tax=Streptomyces humicola TaxID=2953240 RepID=A0ABT1PPU8_9ACTN|nr:chaplin [Streptomyces humicola]MCQ4079713.1 chaplin [Streptomyces humicola]
MSRIAKAVAFVTTTGAVVIAAAGSAAADTGTWGAAVYSPGVLSGNLFQHPIDMPINICGNSFNTVGLLNRAFGKVCLNR